MKSAIKIYIIICAVICVGGLAWIFAPGGRGMRPALAAANNLADYITLLMANSADRKLARQQRAWTALLMEAVEENDIKAARIYLMRGASANVANNATSKTPLFVAIRNNNPDMVALLLEHKANPYQVREDGLMPIHAAVQGEILGEDDNYKGIEIISLLAAAGVNINQRDLDGMTPLMRAGHSYKPMTVKWLIQNGANVNSRDKAGRNALDIAQAVGCEECVDILPKGDNKNEDEQN